MKKLLLFALVISAVMLAVQLPSTVSAAGTVTIGGKVTNQGAPMKNVPVNITVDGTPLSPVTTNDQGNYTVVTNDTVVPPGSTLVIEIDTNGDGVLDGRYEDTVNHNTITFNLDIDPVDVPEYGLLGGVAAAGAGLGFIAWQRRQRQALYQQ